MEAQIQDPQSEYYGCTGKASLQPNPEENVLTFVSTDIPDNSSVSSAGYLQTQDSSIFSKEYLQTQNGSQLTDYLSIQSASVVPICATDNVQTQNVLQPSTGFLSPQNVALLSTYLPIQNNVQTENILQLSTENLQIKNVNKDENEIPHQLLLHQSNNENEFTGQESNICSSIDSSYQSNYEMGDIKDGLQNQNHHMSAIEHSKILKFMTEGQTIVQEENKSSAIDACKSTTNELKIDGIYCSQTQNFSNITDETLKQYTLDKVTHQKGNISTVLGSSNISSNELDNDSQPLEQSEEIRIYKPQSLDASSFQSINDYCKISNHDTTSMETEEVDKHEIYKPLEICCLVEQPSNEFHKENFFKGCKWAPDGTCLLTNSNDNYLRTFDLPPELHCKTVWPPSEEKPKLNYTLKMKEGGIVYDYVWYPKMNSTEGFTAFFLSSSMNAPIHLWDSVGGQIEATYKPYNQVDEVTHAYSLAFSPDGNKIFAGFLSELKIFSTDRPGRQCVARNLKSWFNKSIVSAIAINPVQPEICALGTYSKMIGLFSETDGQPLFFLKGHQGGITHLEFASNGLLLYSGARMDSEILCWDLRNPGCVLYSFPRSVSTNQRVYFDLTSYSNYLLSGNTSGDVSIWNIASPYLPSSPYEETVQEPVHKFSAHQDCTNGVDVHPHYPILATTSGQRHIPLVDSESEQVIENNLKLWWVGM